MTAKPETLERLRLLRRDDYRCRHRDERGRLCGVRTSLTDGDKAICHEHSKRSDREPTL